MDDLLPGDQTGGRGKDKSIHDRRNAILSMLAEKNFVKTIELGAEFGVSEVSIRKDLDYLESRGIIKRIHGGASLSKNAPAILFLSERYVENRRAKEAIAQEAARLLTGPNLRIYLDTGTTVLQLARCIPDESFILIYTNSLTTISALEGKGNVQVISLGGRINYRLKSMDGPIMDAQIDRLRFDICFLGAESVTADSFGCSDMETAHYLRRVMSKSDIVCVLADSSKAAKRSSTVFANPSEVGVFVTDPKIPAGIAEGLGAGGTKVILSPAVD
jgi:DeoR/GlpR family transcriptional regulator of sugar metabolism